MATGSMRLPEWTERLRSWAFVAGPLLLAASAIGERRLRAVVPAALVYLALAAAAAPWGRSGHAEGLRGPSRNARAGLLAMIALAGLFLLALKYPVREYYYDSAAQIEIGVRTREAGFLVNHGQTSGAGIKNPPLFAYVMGLLTAVTTDPGTLTAVTTLANVSAAAAAVWLFLRTLPPAAALLAAAALVVSQASVEYAVLLWEGSLLMPLGVALLFFLQRLSAGGGAGAFVGAAAAAGLAGQCHQSGMLLLPLLGLAGLAHRRRIGARGLAAAAAVVLLVSAPYLHFMLAWGGLEQLARYAGKGGHLQLGTILAVNLGMASTLFTYFPFYRMDFAAYLARAAGPAGWPLYLASLTVAAALAAGWAEYVGWAVARRRLLGPSGREGDPPAVVRAAGFLVTGLTVVFAVAAKDIWYKHALVIFPAQATLAGWGLRRLWGSRPGRAVAVAALASSALLAASIYGEVRRAGGSRARGTIQDYRASFASLVAIRGEVEALVGEAARARVYYRGVWGPSLGTVLGIAGGHPDALPGEPVLVDVRWNSHESRFDWTVAPLGERVASHQAALREVLSVVPPGADVGGFAPEVNVLPAGAPPPRPRDFLPPGARWTRFDPSVSKRRPEWLLLDTLDPRVLVPAPGSWVWDLLHDPGYGLVAESRGVYLFRAGAPAAPGEALLAARGVPLREFLAGGTTGSVGHEPGALFGLARSAGATPARAGTLVDGPVVKVPPGSYELLLRLRGGPGAARGGVLVQLVEETGVAVAERSLAQPAAETGEWIEIPLPFSVEEGPPRAVKPVILVPAGTELAADAPRLVRRQREVP